MATSKRRAHGSVADYLFSAPHVFDFFQAVRLLEGISAEKNIYKPEWKQYPVGYDHTQQREIVHFRVDPALKSPEGDIAKLTSPVLDQHKNRLNPAEMSVTFMGLTGSSGALPMHYSEEILVQNRRKNYALRDFFDMFNHRAISFYYRGWEKYHVQYTFESKRRQGENNDPLTLMLKNIAGIPPNHAIKPLRHDHLLYYAGFLANERKSALNLEMMLSDYFQIFVKIQPFIGHWNKLPPEECTRMPSKKQLGHYRELGRNTILGKRVWYSQGKFRVILGPLTQEELKQFLPGKKGLKVLKAMIRSYVGEEFNFDIQLTSHPHAVPDCELSSINPPQLGYFTWLKGNRNIAEADRLILS